ncbi:MAG: type I-E CRISPR-associated protein Cas6/Cse3/CasE [Thermodesulfobacteriota bacterium]
MYLSSLLIDVGDNPDRPRPGRLWLRNLYHVHQRLCMAFPSHQRTQHDPEFLAPYDPCDFPEQRHLADRKSTEVDVDILKQVHTRRNQDTGFLFRIDPLSGGRAMILVQSASAVKPNWDYAFQNVSFLRAYDVKCYHPQFKRGDFLRFRLMTNPTRRLHSLESDEQARELTQDEVEQFFGEVRRRAQERGLPQLSEQGHIITFLQYSCGHEKRYDFVASRNHKRLFFEAQRACPDCRNSEQKRGQPLKWIGSRVPVRNENDQILKWLGDLGKKKGFLVDKEYTIVQPGYVYWKKQRDDQGQRLRSVRYDGILQVTAPNLLKEAVFQGLGPGKAFGFGLLSLAPCQNPLPEEAP